MPLVCAHEILDSVYINTRPLACGDLILPADQLISNLLTQIGDLILAATSITKYFFLNFLQSMINK